MYPVFVTRSSVGPLILLGFPTVSRLAAATGLRGKGKNKKCPEKDPPKDVNFHQTRYITQFK